MKYQGNCHCGAVSYDVEMETPAKAYACNCSICSRAGWLLAFAPRAGFTLRGEESLVDYQFGPKRTHHRFCKVCGVRPFSHGTDAKGNETVAINLRCVKDFDWTTLPVETFDGAAL
jgi:hypothetical protein